MSDSWKQQLERDAFGNVVEIPVHGDPEQIDDWVYKFRGNRIPLGFVAWVLGRDHRTIQRWAATDKIPGCRTRKRHKPMRGKPHYIIRHCPEFWEWLGRKAHAREGAEMVGKHQATRTIQRNITLRLAVRKHWNTGEAYDWVCEHLGGPFLERLSARNVPKAQRADTLRLQLLHLITEFVRTHGKPPTLQQIFEEMAYSQHFRKKLRQPRIAAGITDKEIKQAAALSWSTFRRRYAPICKQLLQTF